MQSGIVESSKFRVSTTLTQKLCREIIVRSKMNKHLVIGASTNLAPIVMQRIRSQKFQAL